MLDFSKTFREYEALVAEVDKIFEVIQKAHGDCVRCKTHCSDCCHAVFDVTLIESVYLKRHFGLLLDRRDRRRVLNRAQKADRKFYQIKRELQKMYTKEGKSDEEVLSHLAEKRVACPLLNDDDLCVLYEKRPITCRVYGIPTSIRGEPHICGLSGFKEGIAYPTANLDNINSRLFELSRRLAEEVRARHSDMHLRLVPVSAALSTEYDEEYFGLKERKAEDA